MSELRGSNGDFTPTQNALLIERSRGIQPPKVGSKVWRWFPGLTDFNASLSIPFSPHDFISLKIIYLGLAEKVMIVGVTLTYTRTFSSADNLTSRCTVSPARNWRFSLMWGNLNWEAGIPFCKRR